MKYRSDIDGLRAVAVLSVILFHAGFRWFSGGYVGVDIVVDAEDGPMLREANARPGLAIQIANGRGLLPRLADIDEQLDLGRRPMPPERHRARISIEERYRQSA